MIDDFLAIHANSLQLRARRTKILATNIANADTPNYNINSRVSGLMRALRGE